MGAGRAPQRTGGQPTRLRRVRGRAVRLRKRRPSSCRSTRISCARARQDCGTRARLRHAVALRQIAVRLSRFYAVESTPTNSGTKADHRLPLKPSEVEHFARALAAALGAGGAATGAMSKVAEAWIAPLVKDLQAHRGQSLIIAGDGQPPIVHALTHAMNAALGSVGTTVVYTPNSRTASDEPARRSA